MKEHVSRDIQQHFIDDGCRIVTVDDLTEKDKKGGSGKTESKVADIKVSQVQVAEVKVVEDESKVVTVRFNGKVAELREVDIGLVTNVYVTLVVKTVVATVDGLNTDILFDTETYESLLEQERIYSPIFTAAMNLRSDSSKKSLDESVNTENEEHEPTITEYDEENGNNTEKFKKQQQIYDTLQEAWNFVWRNKEGYVIENDILYHEELLGGNMINQLVIPEMRKKKILEIAHDSVFEHI
ncbi:retrovirus-related Pol polyprotein from transposon opus [Trichonephila clavipes]|uniref:Retrovirus-related Pol polyprotein from transposon opus n=1 Tax=Trichonephila clavipes TaxID=2585209 RepID=A0A8X6VFR8_TRICX|nr:retrovirus-related Pol polyprotein from transposon opus [Trichonephila clavipes]